MTTASLEEVSVINASEISLQYCDNVNINCSVNAFPHFYFFNTFLLFTFFDKCQLKILRHCALHIKTVTIKQVT